MAKGAGGGRPKADIDLHQLKSLMRMSPTLEDTAAFFGVSVKTIERLIEKHYQLGFVQFREQNAVHTRLNISRALIQKAESGDLGAIIWYTKNKMGWSDRQQTTVEHRLQEAVKDVSNISKEDAKILLTTAVKSLQALNDEEIPTYEVVQEDEDQDE